MESTYLEVFDVEIYFLYLAAESTGEVAASSKEAKYEVFVFKADPDDLTFINCDVSNLVI